MQRSFSRETGKKISTGSESSVRVTVLFFVVLIVAFVILGRLFDLQIRDHGEWIARAEEQRRSSFELSSERGEIFMHDGKDLYPLAVNKEFPYVFVAPNQVTDKDRVIEVLHSILGIEQDELAKKLSNENDPFEIVKKRVSDEEVAKIRESELEGVGIKNEKYRYYPGGSLAAHVVGFASLGERGGSGGYGVEASLDGRLRGDKRVVSQERDASGRWIALSDRMVTEAPEGENVVLTLDRVIQHETEKILKEAYERHEADAVSGIVMDPNTGKILAMAAYPDFDPNQYSKIEDFGVFMNPTVSLPYEPGSVMKPVTMAIGIEEGKVSPNTEYTDTGSVTESGYTIRNSQDKVYGRSSMNKVLEESINTGMIFVERLVGNKTFRDSLKRFGFGERTGVGLPAELSGNLRSLDDTRANLNYYTASFGQGITTTPLQLVSAYATLANGGILLRPQIVEKYIRTDGTEEVVQPEEIRRVISRETSEVIGRMLRLVVTDGHGKRADVPGYEVVGKTGTAQVAKKDGKGYEEGMTIGSFLGYAPRHDPRFVVLVKIDNPKDVEWAESSAAPTFGSIMKFLLQYAEVEPDSEKL